MTAHRIGLADAQYLAAREASRDEVFRYWQNPNPFRTWRLRLWRWWR